MTILHCMFDFDGTLVDTVGDVLECLKSAFAKQGMPPESLHVPTFMQLQLRESIASMVPRSSAEVIDEIVAAFRTAYDASDYPATKLMPGVARLLPELQARSIGMSIVSNKRHFPTLRILNKFGIGAFFEAVYNPDMNPEGPAMTKGAMIARAITEQRLLKETTLYIGDSGVDVVAADENNLSSVIVANGYGSVDGFRHRPTYVVKAIGEILTIDGMIGPKPKQAI